MNLTAGLQGFSKKIKQPPAERRSVRPLSSHLPHCNCYNAPKDLPTPATWPTPSCPYEERYAATPHLLPLISLAYSFLLPTRKAHSFPHPYCSNICSQPTSKCIQRPRPSPTNQHVSMCTARPLLALCLGL